MKQKDRRQKSGETEKTVELNISPQRCHGDAEVYVTHTVRCSNIIYSFLSFLYLEALI